MRIILDRRLVTPVLLALGLLVMLGGEIDLGAWIDAIALGYWVAGGWGMRLIGGQEQRRRRAGQAANRPSPATAAKVVGRPTGTDGVGGAFSRLHPQTQAWLAREIQARKDTQ